MNARIEFERSFQTARGVDKGGHHGVTDRLDDRAVATRDDFANRGEVVGHDAEGGRIAGLRVDRGRADDVGEEHRQRFYAEIEAGREYLRRKHIAKLLQRGDLRGGGDGVGPFAVFDAHDGLTIEFVDQTQRLTAGGNHRGNVDGAAGS